MKARQARHLGLETKSTGNKRPKRKQTEHRVLKFEQEQGADTKDYYSYSTKGCGAKIGKKVWYEELLLIRTAERRGYEVLLLLLLLLLLLFVRPKPWEGVERIIIINNIRLTSGIRPID